MDFGPSHSNLYSPYIGMQRYRCLPPGPYSYSYPDLSYHPSDSYGIDTPQRKDEGLVSHLDVLSADIQQVSRADPLNQFFAGKKAFLSKSVEEMVGLIYEREHLKHENIHKIDYDACRVGTKLLQLYEWPVGSNSNIDSTRTNLLREINAFEREKRMEEVACWRDVCRVKSDLREVMREVSQEKFRQDLISGEL